MTQEQEAIGGFTSIERFVPNWPALSELYVNHALIAPRGFTSGEFWQIYAYCLLARAHYTVQSIFLLSGREADSGALARILYEHVLTFAWIMVDPRNHYLRMLSWEHKERRKVAVDIAKFGGEGDEAESELRLRTIGLDLSVPAAPEAFDRSLQADAFWDAKVAGWPFHFRRNYAFVFRPYSAHVHPTFSGLKPFFEFRDGKMQPTDPAPQHPGTIEAEALVIFADALVVSAAAWGWPPHSDVVLTLLKGALDDQL